jgi:hypothetical protein
MYGFQTAIIGALAVFATAAVYRFDAREADPSADAYDFVGLEARNIDPYSYLSGRSLEAREESFRRRYLTTRMNRRNNDLYNLHSSEPVTVRLAVYFPSLFLFLRLLFVLAVVVKYREGIELTNRFPVYTCDSWYLSKTHPRFNLRFRR